MARDAPAGQKGEQRHFMGTQGGADGVQPVLLLLVVLVCSGVHRARRPTKCRRRIGEEWTRVGCSWTRVDFHAALPLTLTDEPPTEGNSLTDVMSRSRWHTCGCRGKDIDGTGGFCPPQVMT